jgi:hypothetical protein
MVDLRFREFEAAGRPRPERWVLDVYVNAVEYTCYQLYLETEATPQDVDRARQVMLRMALATLGSQNDWEVFHANPHLFDTPETSTAESDGAAGDGTGEATGEAGPAPGTG